jgi:hypothetical protein
MAVFEALCEGYLGISAHWHLFKYFFMFVCLKDGSKAAKIDCANLLMKQGRGDNYIPSSLTSSNSDWHKGWFYLRNDPEFTLPVFIGNSIAQGLRSWIDGPPEGGAGEVAQGPLGGADPPPRGWGQPGNLHWPAPCPGSHPASEAATVLLRDDNRQGPLDRDCNRARILVAERDPALCDTPWIVNPPGRLGDGLHDRPTSDPHHLLLRNNLEGIIDAAV